MFLPETMLHARLVVPRQKSQELMIALHEAGLCELKEAEAGDLEGLEVSESAQIVETRQRLAGLLADMQEFKPVRQPENLVKSLFFPGEPEKIRLDLLSNKAVLKEVNSHLDIIHPKAEKQLLELKGIRQRIGEIGLEIEGLSDLPDVGLEIFSSTKNIAVFVGIVTKKGALELGSKLKKSVFLLKERDENTSLLMLACRQSERQSTEKELHGLGFDPLDVAFSNGTPKEIVAGLEAEAVKLRKRIREIRLFLQNMAKMHWKKLLVLSEELSACVERADAMKQLKAGKSFVVFEAWIPKKNLEKFNSLVKKNTGSFFLLADEREDAPTLLNNPSFLKPFEMITALYSLPKSKGLDPTPVIAITFSFFFGYMLTDFAYGLALALIAFAIFRGIGKYDVNLKNFSAVLIALGIFMALLGAAFTSYFGDFFPRIGIQMPGIVDPLKEVIVIIGLAVLVGLLHISLGLLMGFVDNLRLGNRQKAFSKQGVWLLFLIGVAVAVLGNMTVALALIVLSVLMHVVFSVLEGGPVIGMLSVFDFSGFVGDVFSYARLTALAIGTAGIALAVNFMALMVIDMVPVIGFPIAILVFLVGHSFNMVMNGLGAFIHALRLHFLEFFQKFYDGGGRAYKPFHVEREKIMGGV